MDTVRLLLALAFVPAVLLAQDPPPVEEPPVEDPPVFDPSADVRARVEAARRLAARHNQRLLVVFGADGSRASLALVEMAGEEGTVGRMLPDEFLTVPLEAEAAAEQGLLESLGVTLEGLPHIAVLDAEGRVLVQRSAAQLLVEGQPVSARILELLREHKAEPLDAKAIVADARAVAEKDGRKLLIEFVAPRCAPCRSLTEFLEGPDVAPILARDLVVVRVDQERMTGGKELAAELRSGGQDLPWMVITDAKLSPIVTSDGAEGNIGDPLAQAEIEHFMTMLRAVAQAIDEQQMKKLETSLANRATELGGERAVRKGEGGGKQGGGKQGG